MDEIFAFPVPHSIDGNWREKPLPEYCGMTLRDYFAAIAMGNFFARNRNRELIDSPQEIADASYEIADAMLKAREK